MTERVPDKNRQVGWPKRDPGRDVWLRSSPCPQYRSEEIRQQLGKNGGRDRTRTCDLLRVNWPGGALGGEAAMIVSAGEGLES
jgi:hypothetical protein